jgi:hypothetical protein
LASRKRDSCCIIEIAWLMACDENPRIMRAMSVGVNAVAWASSAP